MAERYHSQEAVDMLISMGAAFPIQKKTDYSLDPEAQILKSLRFYWDYNSVFFLMLSALRYRTGKLIHIERLIKLAKLSQLPKDQIILLIAISDKLAQYGDTRFLNVRKKLYRTSMKMIEPPKIEAQSSLIKVNGIEETLKPFGVKVRAFSEVPPKKLYRLEKINSLNHWLKYRSIIGPNTRADVVYLLLNGIASSPSEAARIAQCSRQAASLISNSIEPFRDQDSIVLKSS